MNASKNAPMTILEAIASGKPFKRAGWGTYLYPLIAFQVTDQDVVAQDWELMVPQVTLQLPDFQALWDQVAASPAGQPLATSSDPTFAQLIKGMGF